MSKVLESKRTINEKINALGCYSNAGRNSAKKFHIINLRESMQHKDAKKSGLIFDLFFPDNEDDNQNMGDDDDDSLIEKIDIFAENLSKKNIKKEKKNNKNNKSSLKTKLLNKNNITKTLKNSNSAINLKYHNNHHDHLKEISEHLKRNADEPNCTKYDPKFDYIWSKLNLGPKWSTVTGRKYKKIDDDGQFYITHQNISKTNKQVFIDMKKQTMRNGLPGRDLRIRYEKKYDPNSNRSPDIKKINIHEIYDPLGGNYNSNNTDAKDLFNNKDYIDYYNEVKNKIYKENNKENITNNIATSNKNTLNNNEINPHSAIGFYKTTNSLMKSNKFTEADKSKNRNFVNNFIESKLQNTSYNFSYNLPISPSDNYTKKKIKMVPDFKRQMSRDKLNKRFEVEKLDAPIINPNYKAIYERPCMMVVYEKNKSMPKNIKNIQGIDYTYNINLGDHFNNINNHRTYAVPNFQNYVSRPYDDKNNPLPMYMKKVFTRASCYGINENSLKMNNFSKSKYIDPFSSFIPKKSFNKNINLCLLNSEKIKHTKSAESYNNKNDMKKYSNFMRKTMRFYTKDLDELINENEFNKFDNITLKTYKKCDPNSLFLSGNGEKNLKKFLSNLKIKDY